VHVRSRTCVLALATWEVQPRRCIDKSELVAPSLIQ
jgi:hypothetical protein